MNNQQSTKVQFSYFNPIPWRIIDPGLCLEGRCMSNKKVCSAHGQMVVGNFQLGKFTISRIHTFKCPICGNSVYAEKFGLNRCQWRMIHTNKWSTVSDIYETYDLHQFPIYIEICKLNEDYVSDENCTICLISMNKKNKCSILPCKHLFHTECIHNWIDSEEETSLQCPICRKDIFQ